MDTLQNTKPDSQSDEISDSEEVSIARECDGCRDLRKRVEHLESLLQRGGYVGRSAQRPPVRMSTHTCYAICLFFHAMLLAITCNDDLMILAGLPLVCGAISTLAICHALANRSVALKMLRSWVSFAVCMFAVTIPMILSSGWSVFESVLGLYSTIVVTVCGISCWSVAKVFGLCTGWRIIVPGIKGAKQPLRVQDLLAITLFAAVWLAAMRFFADEFSEYASTEATAIIGILALTSALTTIIGILVARMLLNESGYVPFGRLALTVLSGAGLVSVLVLIVIISLEAGSWDSEVLLYVASWSIFFASSPLLTFTLMRFAGYEMPSMASESSADQKTQET